MKRWSTRRNVLGLAAALLPLLAACFTDTGPLLVPPEAGPPSLDLTADAGPPGDGDIGDPFAINGLTPSHGPFTGGTRASLDGRGFSSSLHVFVGEAEVAAGSLLASDPTRAAIVVPPGRPGFVDVRIHDDATANDRVLANGFFYDAFVVLPDSGATSGGTRIALTGSGTAWVAGTTAVTVAGVACTDVVVASATSLTCVTPAGTPGSKDVVVDGVQARDAFTYSDSTDGYRGGLSGGALAGRLKVLAFDSLLGKPIPAAWVVVGTDLAKTARTSSSGVVEIADVAGAKVTVTVAAKCFSPKTYVDVPVDTVTVYLDPELDLACASGDPQQLPGRAVFGGSIEGQLIFPTGSSGNEIGSSSNWANIPAPRRPTERKAAYVFEATGSPSAAFVLPPASEAITPDDVGTNGFLYSTFVFPGNATLYVVAGLEDRSATPPSFVPYAMGVARGITVPAQTRVRNVDIAMNVYFDHRVTVAANPPAPGPRGPDRFTASVATTLGASRFAVFPLGTRTVALPAPAETPFVGVPALDRAMAGEKYVIGGVAATGPASQLPASVVSRVMTTSSDVPVTLGGFLGVPVLGEPASGVWAGKHVAFSGASGPVDLSLTEVTSGPLTWTIVAPGSTNAYDLPDLGALPSADRVGLPHGAISTTVYVARIDGFSYGTVRDGQLSTGAWSAYAFDALGGVY